MLILGSKSPRRKEILEMAQIPFKVELIDVSEDVNKDNPIHYVKETALKKGLVYSNHFKDDIILCADTIVELDGKILEKPKDKEDARNMISKLSNRCHLVHTAAFIGTKNNYEVICETTKVYVTSLSEAEIEDYISTNEPYDKAGAYAIQGIFGKYIDKIEGDYYNVMGLPLSSVVKVLKNHKYI